MYSAPVNIIFHYRFLRKYYTIQRPPFIFCKPYTVNNISHMFLSLIHISYAGDFVLFGNWEFLKSINRKKVAHSAISFVFWCIWVFSQRYIFVSVFVSGFDQLLELVQGHSVYAGSEIIFIYEDDFIMGQIDTGTAGEFDH